METSKKLCTLIGNQSHVSRKTGISQSAISEAIAGKRRLYLDQAFLIARAIGVSLDYLADDTLDVPPAAEISEDERGILDVIRALRLDKSEVLRRLYREDMRGESTGHADPARGKAVMGHSVPTGRAGPKRSKGVAG